MKTRNSLTSWWYFLTMDNWGFPYHWIIGASISFLFFHFFGSSGIFYYSFSGIMILYEIYQYFWENGDLLDSLQDLLAGFHGMGLAAYMYYDLNDLEFWSITLIGSVVLYLVTKELKND